MTIDVTWASWFITASVLYYTLLFAVSLVPRRRLADDHRERLMVLLVPARNEEIVIEGTLRAMSRLEYDGPRRVLVIDDGSQDATPQITDRWAAQDPDVRVLHRVAPHAAQGKSEALNHAYRQLCDWLAAGDPWLAGREPDDVILVIVDADGRLQSGALAEVAPYFADPAVGGTQIGVRIWNARDNLLARMQDLEFVGFSWLVQRARDWWGSTGLGGNGQFTRLSALMSLGEEPWRRGALTEDLDLGLRMVGAGWRVRFCHRTYVDQQGLTTWRPLLRQRTRWIQGHYQCWRHLGPLLRARRAPLLTRLDLAVYLLLVVSVVLVTYTMVVGILGLTGVVLIENDFLGAVPYGPWRRSAALVLAILPLVICMVTAQLHSAHPFRWFEVPAAGLAFTLFSYAWVFATVRALVNIARRRNTWVKTPRVVSPAG